jgi:hypothetical protein
MPVKYTIRSDGFGAEETVTLNPQKAIRKFCRECYGFEVSWQEMVKECPSTLCPLFPFRFGKDPGRVITTKHMATAKANFAATRRGGHG